MTGFGMGNQKFGLGLCSRKDVCMSQMIVELINKIWVEI